MTAELALALPAVVGLLLVVVLLSGAATAQLRCADAARAGARAAALGEDVAEVTAVAGRVAGGGAGVAVSRGGEWVTVTVHRPLGPGPLAPAGLTARATATARIEP
ncbi:TadE family type IV pilus minor pilin [uncultured Cellulomonas sp.]|uniref:TadE family type IV pilus minor pilin n=1 Tax=uncultured Cellulomonas sp. TaxID=189682 RepID=UPI0026078930|nr:TadE family type IV pilus minor pilin [uncultured Cellulomonas sp.]